MREYHIHLHIDENMLSQGALHVHLKSEPSQGGQPALPKPARPTTPPPAAPVSPWISEALAPSGYSGPMTDQALAPSGYSGPLMDQAFAPSGYSGPMMDQSLAPSGYSGPMLDQALAPSGYSGPMMDQALTPSGYAEPMMAQSPVPSGYAPKTMHSAQAPPVSGTATPSSVPDQAYVPTAAQQVQRVRPRMYRLDIVPSTSRSKPAIERSKRFADANGLVLELASGNQWNPVVWECCEPAAQRGLWRLTVREDYGRMLGTVTYSRDPRAIWVASEWTSRGTLLFEPTDAKSCPRLMLTPLSALQS